MAFAPQVVVVGSIMQDLTLACAEFPQPGETIVGQLRTGQGGKGSNQAIACGKTGVRTTFVGAMGDDAYARQVAAFYRREKIGCQLALKRDRATGTAVILINGRGQNEIVIEPGANAALRASDLPAALIAGAKVLITQLEANLATTAHALRVARKAGVLTVLNPAPMRADFDARLLRHVDVLIPNESEFAALVRVLPQVQETGFDERQLHALPDADLHALCRRIGVGTVIVTLGERGCFVSERDAFTRVPAHRGVKVVDTTGAGDAFCGGFAAGLVRSGGRIVDAVRLGTAVAALSVTKAGAAPSMPARAELRKFLGREQAAAWRL